MASMLAAVLSLVVVASWVWASAQDGGAVSSSVGPVREMQSCHDRTELELLAIEDALPRFVRVKTEQARDFLKRSATTSLRR